MHFNIWHESRLKPTNYKRAEIDVLQLIRYQGQKTTEQEKCTLN